MEIELKKYNVIRDKNGAKKVIFVPRKIEDGEEFICDDAHDDGDYSYCCGSDYCKCSG